MTGTSVVLLLLISYVYLLLMVMVMLPGRHMLQQVDRSFDYVVCESIRVGIKRTKEQFRYVRILFYLKSRPNKVVQLTKLNLYSNHVTVNNLERSLAIVFV